MAAKLTKEAIEAWNDESEQIGGALMGKWSKAYEHASAGFNFAIALPASREQAVDLMRAGLAEIEQLRAVVQAETEDRRRQVGELQRRLAASEDQCAQNWIFYEKAKLEYDEANAEVKVLRAHNFNLRAEVERLMAELDDQAVDAEDVRREQEFAQQMRKERDEAIAQLRAKE